MKRQKGNTQVGCKWVFTMKYNSNGLVERYKAILVAKGFTLTLGIDYQEMFAPIARPYIVWILLSLVANLDWPFQQLDVKNAFLMGISRKKHTWTYHQILMKLEEMDKVEAIIKRI